MFLVCINTWIYFKVTARTFITCVASVSVGFGSKERPRNGIFGVFSARKMGREPKQRKRGVGEGKEGNACVSFRPSFPSPPPSFTRSIFRAVILCSRTPQKRLLRRLRPSFLLWLRLRLFVVCGEGIWRFILCNSAMDFFWVVKLPRVHDAQWIVRLFVLFCFAFLFFFSFKYHLMAWF